MTGTKTVVEALCKVIKRMHYLLEVMLVCVRWDAAYPLSFRHIEEMMGAWLPMNCAQRGMRAPE